MLPWNTCGDTQGLVRIAPAKQYRMQLHVATNEQLSDRELAVFDLLGQGLGTRQIAETLRLSIKTVQAYCTRIKEKLHLSSATELLREAVRQHESPDVG